MKQTTDKSTTVSSNPWAILISRSVRYIIFSKLHINLPIVKDISKYRVDQSEEMYINIKEKETRNKTIEDSQNHSKNVLG